MTTYNYYNYLFFAQTEKSELEKVFEDLILKVDLYKKQYELTIKLYKSEWENENTTLRGHYAKSEIIAKEVYNKAYDEMEGEEEYIKQSYADHLSGLDYLNSSLYEDTNNLTARYMDFLDLFSKSLLTALYSMIESKFKEICDIISKEFGYKLKYEHLDSRDYLNTSINYLELVAQIPIDTLEPYISKLKQIQFIRNKIIHNESKFSESNEKTIKSIVQNSKGTLELKNENSLFKLRIKKSHYINDFINLIREFFEELIWLIDNKQSNKIFIKRLEYWFGLLDNKIFIKNVKSTKVGIGKRNIEFILSSRKRNIPKLKCLVSISRAETNSLDIIDQTENKSINEFNAIVISNQSFLFDDVFELFNQSSKGIKLRVMMSEI